MTAVEECISNIVVNYHRNGVGGAGFHAIHFTWADPTEPYCSGRLIAIVKDYDDSTKDELKPNGDCFVVNSADPTQCYRGDTFEVTMRRIMKRHDIDWHNRIINNKPSRCSDPSTSYYNNFQQIRETVVKNAKGE